MPPQLLLWWRKWVNKFYTRNVTLKYNCFSWILNVRFWETNIFRVLMILKWMVSHNSSQEIPAAEHVGVRPLYPAFKKSRLDTRWCMCNLAETGSLWMRCRIVVIVFEGCPRALHELLKRPMKRLSARVAVSERYELRQSKHHFTFRDRVKHLTERCDRPSCNRLNEFLSSVTILWFMNSFISN
jgi:hypothetical protein